MKKLMLCLFSICMIMLVAGSARAEDDVQLIIEQELQAFDFSKWNYTDESFNFNAEEMIEKYLNGKGELNTTGIVDFIFDKIKNIVLGKLPIVLMLLAAGAVSGLCSAFIPDEHSEIRDLLAFITCAMCVAVVSGAVAGMIKTAVEAVERAAMFAEGAMPVMSLIMIASGKHATEAVFSPVMAFLSGTMTLIIKTTVIPIITVGFVIAIIGAFGGRLKTGKFLGLAKSTAKWVCGILTTVFTGAVTVYGLGAKARDTLTMKTTKYVIDKSVPIVGSFLASSADTVLECFIALKTAAGAVFMLAIIIISVKPLLDILGTVISLRIAAALCEPVADERIPKLMSDTADVAKFLFAAVAMMNVMLIIAVGICACILN